MPPSGGGPLPNFPDRPEGPAMGPGPGFPGGGLGTLAAMSLGVNQGPPQQPPIREMGQQSPWHSSFRSQTGSTRSSSYPDVMNWTPQNRVGSWAEGMHPEQMTDSLPRYRGVEQILSPLNEPELRTAASTWTSLTSDNTLVQHLLAQLVQPQPVSLAQTVDLHLDQLPGCHQDQLHLYSKCLGL